MSVELSYQKYLTKVEQNSTNDNIATSRGNFTLLFNENQNRFIEFHLQQRGIDDIRYIEKFLVLDKKLPQTSKTLDRCNFTYPKDYLDLVELRALASKGKCDNQVLYLWEITNEDINELMQDEYNKPSFKWRESFYTVNSGNLSVYIDREDPFNVDNILLSYYRYPNQIKLVNETDPESPFNEAIEIEWDDKALDRIISMCAGDSDLNQNNPRFQAQNFRTQK